MTVKRIQMMQRQQLNTAVANDPAVLMKFRNGFSECATEVLRFVDRLENVEPVIKHRLMSHMNKCVNQLQQIAPFCGHHVPYVPERFPDVKVGFPNDLQNGDENNNGSARIQIPNGVKLIPSRLPTGELAFLVPQSAGISANFPFFPPAESSARISQLSAFTAVHRSHSPLLSPSTSTSSSTYGDESHHSEQPQRPLSPNQPHTSRAEPFKFASISETVSSKSSLSSSPETQKPQVSSSSDRSPVPTCSEPKLTDADNAAVATSEKTAASDLVAYRHLRRPLSVITDKASNRTCDSPPDRKRRKIELPTSANEQSVANDDPATTSRASDQNLNEFPTSPTAQGPFNANSDMWRPW